MLSVGFHNPDFPDDIVFDVGGIAIPNNGSVELDHDAELLFYARYQKGVKDYFKDNPHITISGSTELSKAERAMYPGEEEVSTETIIPEGEVDPTIPDEATEGSES